VNNHDNVEGRVDRLENEFGGFAKGLQCMPLGW